MDTKLQALEKAEKEAIKQYELERVQTGIEMCLSNRCIYFDPRLAKCMAGNPNECTVLIGKPSKLKSEKK